MKKLSYDTLKEIGYNGFLLEDAPCRVLQFGEGGFLRAFVDYFIDVMNEKSGFNSKVIVTQPIAPGLADMINEQDGLYTLYLRGVKDGSEVTEKRIISCISECLNPYKDYSALLNCAKIPELRFIVSNTTEAGIVFDENSKFDQEPPNSFPAKLTRFMYERFTNKMPGFIILSCELIDNNGKELKKCVDAYCDLWNLSDEFKKWVEEENIFCSTLVDRIVTGYPRSEAQAINNENGYEDNLIDTGEIFGLWVIEGPDSIKEEFPFEKADLPILVTADHSPYKQRKVRILNGAHTATVPCAYMSGIDTVLEFMEDEVISEFLKNLLNDEIIPTLTLPKEEVLEFAASVSDRFKNPYIRHEVLSIALNGTSKWKARLMPSLLGYYNKFNELPKNITFSFAALIWFYHTGKELKDGVLIGDRDGNPFDIRDDAFVLEFYAENSGLSIQELAAKVIANERMWGTELKNLQGFEEAVCANLEKIQQVGMKEAVRSNL